MLFALKEGELADVERGRTQLVLDPEAEHGKKRHRDETDDEHASRVARAYRHARVAAFAQPLPSPPPPHTHGW